MPPKPLPLPVSLGISIAVLAIVGGGALLAAYIVGKIPAARPFQRALISFTCLCGVAIAATILQVVLPPLNEQPFTSWLGVTGLTASAAISTCLLLGAQGRKESAALLLILGATVFTLVISAWPLLPALPPLTDLFAAWAATGTVFVLPYRFIRRCLTRRLAIGRSETFTAKMALSMTAGYAVAFLAFTALAWRGLHPALLPPAFAWAGAGYGAVTLLNIAVLYGYTFYVRGRLQRWLRPEEEGSLL